MVKWNFNSKIKKNCKHLIVIKQNKRESKFEMKRILWHKPWGMPLWTKWVQMPYPFNGLFSGDGA